MNFTKAKDIKPSGFGDLNKGVKWVKCPNPDNNPKCLVEVNKLMNSGLCYACDMYREKLKEYESLKKKKKKLVDQVENKDEQQEIPEVQRKDWL